MVRRVKIEKIISFEVLRRMDEMDRIRHSPSTSVLRMLEKVDILSLKGVIK